MKWVLFFSLWFLIFNSAIAIPNDWYYGRQINCSDAQSIGLAGSVVLKSRVSFDNLGLCGFASAPQFMLTYNLGFISERRTKMLYDQFDNTLGEVAFAENLLTTGKLGTTGFIYPTKYLNVNASIRPQYIFDYRFYQEFRDDFYAKIGEKEIKLTGSVYKMALSLSREFYKKIGLGVGVNYYFGNRKYWYHDSIVFIRQLTAETTGTPKGLGFSIGSALIPFERMLICIDYQSGPKLKNWSNNSQQQYPYIINAKFAYFASGVIPTQIGLSGQYTNWKRLNSTFAQTIETGIGIEHIFLNGVAFRYGFRLEPSFTPPVVHQGSISLGWGFAVGTLRIDIGADIKRRIIGSENLLFSTDNDVKVYQNSGEIVISVSKTL
ncbi:MAG: hypothetical protein N2201_05145 [candidate division WOR-3 bacterium]|nr:hypothetical protein [candidate division WOR-3 bacterium]